MGSAYALALLAHSWLRWAVLAACLLVLVRAARGWKRARPYAPADERVARALLGLVDTQLLLGLLLYLVLSPISHAAFADPRAAFWESTLRFFGLEHAFGMIAGILTLHVGLLRGRRRGQDPARHRTVSIALAAALLLFLVSIPWPGLPYARPLLRTGRAAYSPAGAAVLRAFSNRSFSDDARMRLPRSRFMPPPKPVTWSVEVRFT